MWAVPHWRVELRIFHIYVCVCVCVCVRVCVRALVYITCRMYTYCTRASSCVTTLLAEHRTQTDILLVTSQWSVSRLSSCVLSMRGDFICYSQMLQQATYKWLSLACQLTALLTHARPTNVLVKYDIMWTTRLQWLFWGLWLILIWRQISLLQLLCQWPSLYNQNQASSKFLALNCEKSPCMQKLVYFDSTIDYSLVVLDTHIDAHTSIINTRHDCTRK